MHSASIAEGLRLEESLRRALIGQPKQVKSVKAIFEKSAPHFQDPS